MAWVECAAGRLGCEGNRRAEEVWKDNACGRMKHPCRRVPFDKLRGLPWLVNLAVWLDTARERAG
jgi:hypothetical protein